MFPSLLRSILFFLAFSLVVSCSKLEVVQDTRPASKPSFTFAVMGDVPYGLSDEELRHEEATLGKQLKALNKTDVPFVVHLGDIKKGAPPCEPGVYKTVSTILKTSAHPLFIIPGDNEWNDCKDPTDAWNLWTKHFMRFDETWTHDLGVSRQENREENFAFKYKGALFLGINLPGGKVHDWEEWEARIADNVKWLKAQFANHRNDTESAVLFAHANPGKLENGEFSYNTHAFRPLIEYLDSGTATDYPKPILLLHGDGHKWIKDHPFPNAGKRITRIQVTQGGLESPLHVEVRSDPTTPFFFIRTP